MMKSVTILGETFYSNFNRVDVVKSIVNDDDTVELNLHSISTESLEWKAAECGIMDINLLLDAILFEPFVDQNDPRGLIEKTQDFKSTRVVANRSNSAAKTSLRAAKVGDVYVNAVDNDAYELLTQKCPFNPEVIAVISESMNKSKERQKPKKSDEVDRVANIKRILDRNQHSDRGGRVSVPKKSNKLETIELGKGKQRKAI